MTADGGATSLYKLSNTLRHTGSLLPSRMVAAHPALPAVEKSGNQDSRTEPDRGAADG